MMKKTIIIIFVIAVLGILAGYALTQDSSDKTTSQSSAQQTRDWSTAANHYKDGSYSSNETETLYGNIKISIVITGGKISDVLFLQMPDKADGRSRQLTEMSKPLLKATTLAKQSDQIDFVTGATSTSYGYQESLQSALDKAAQASENRGRS